MLLTGEILNQISFINIILFQLSIENIQEPSVVNRVTKTFILTNHS